MTTSSIIKPAALYRFKPLPELKDVAPGIAPHEFNVLVLPRELESETTGGIMLPDHLKDREKEAAVEGLLVAVSPAAFSYAEWPQGTAQPQPGQCVLFSRYAGLLVKGDDGRTYRVLKDKDVIAIKARASDTLEGAWG